MEPELKKSVICLTEDIDMRVGEWITNNKVSFPVTSLSVIQLGGRRTEIPFGKSQVVDNIIGNECDEIVDSLEEGRSGKEEVDSSRILNRWNLKDRGIAVDDPTEEPLRDWKLEMDDPADDPPSERELNGVHPLKDWGVDDPLSEWELNVAEPLADWGVKTDEPQKDWGVDDPQSEWKMGVNDPPSRLTLSEEQSKVVRQITSSKYSPREKLSRSSSVGASQISRTCHICCQVIFSFNEEQKRKDNFLSVKEKIAIFRHKFLDHQVITALETLASIALGFGVSDRKRRKLKTFELVLNWIRGEGWQGYSEFEKLLEKKLMASKNGREALLWMRERQKKASNAKKGTKMII